MQLTDKVSQRPFPTMPAVIGGFILIFVLAGCTSVGAQDNTTAEPRKDTMRAQQTNQVIIKFRDSAFNPTQPDILNTLPCGIGVTLIYLHPMTGVPM